MRKGFIWIPIAVLAVVGGTLGVRMARGGTASTAIATKYAFGTAQRGSLKVTVTGSGTVAAGATAEVYPTEAGSVASLAAEVGQEVQAGQLLATIDDQDQLLNELANDRLQLREDKAGLAALLSPSPTATEIASAKEQIVQAQAKLAADEAAAQAAAAIAAPISGDVLMVDTASGDAVQSGQDLLEIGSTGSWQVAASVDQIELQEVYKGEGGEATGAAISPALQVYISSIDPTSSGSGRDGAVYPMVLTVEGTENLRAGEQVTVSLPGSYLTVSGSVQYAQTAEVQAPIAGTAEGLSVAVGDEVQQGESLLSIKSSAQALAVLEDQASLASAQEGLIGISQGDSPTSNAVLAAEAKVSSDVQAIVQAEEAIAGLRLTSPIAGEVTAVDVTSGAQVSAGGSAAFTVENVRQKTVEVAVDERSVNEIRVGEPATITSEAYAGDTFLGQVASIAPVGTNSEGVSTFNVDVALEGAGKLLPGMAASVTIDAEGAQDALLVPAEAVSGSGRSATVKELVKGHVVRLHVVAGISSESFTEILSGLKAGDRVITATAVSETVQSGKPSGGAKMPSGTPPSGGTPPGGTAPSAPSGGQ